MCEIRGVYTQLQDLSGFGCLSGFRVWSKGKKKRHPDAFRGLESGVYGRRRWGLGFHVCKELSANA